MSKRLPKLDYRTRPHNSAHNSARYCVGLNVVHGKHPIPVGEGDANDTHRMAVLSVLSGELAVCLSDGSPAYPHESTGAQVIIFRNSLNSFLGQCLIGASKQRA